MIIDPLELFSLPAGVYIVRRPTLPGVGYHFGVYLPDRSIIDFGSDHVVTQQDPFEFARGLGVEVVRTVPDSEHFNAHLRLQRSIEWPTDYDLMNWNCETFATWIAGERPRSDQVEFAFIVTAGALALIGLAQAAAKARG